MRLRQGAMKLLALAALALLAGCIPSAERARPVATRPPTPADRTIAANLADRPSLSILSRAVTLAGFVPTLSATGPLTLFAPTDQAFGRLAPGTVEGLLKPENHGSLVKLLNLHLVAGRLTAAELTRRIAAGGGRATLTTLGGETLTASMTGDAITLTDGGGDRSYIEAADNAQANGVVHLVNGVLVPRI